MKEAIFSFIRFMAAAFLRCSHMNSFIISSPLLVVHESVRLQKASCPCLNGQQQHFRVERAVYSLSEQLVIYIVCRIRGSCNFKQNSDVCSHYVSIICLAHSLLLPLQVFDRTLTFFDVIRCPRSFERELQFVFTFAGLLCDTESCK